jgi:phage/plasmid-like protein (TIGR03299 family)
MAHHITKTDQMFSVKETPWHRLGKVVEQAPSISEGLQLANLDWTVKTVPLFTKENIQVTHKAVVREDTNHILGVVGPNWTPLQNKDAFNFFNDFIEQKVASLETAGSLRGGEIVWVLAKINIDPIEVVKNDPIERYILLSNGHNGLLAVRAGFTNIRVVCNNTLTIAHNSEESKLLRVKHTSNVKTNLDLIQTIMNVQQSQFVADIDKMRLLTKSDIVKKDIEKFVKMTFFKNKPVETERQIHNVNKMVLQLEDLIENGKGADIKNVKGTMWNLYNAATEYTTHLSSKTDESRLHSLWFGQNSKLNDLFLTTALEMVYA